MDKITKKEFAKRLGARLGISHAKGLRIINAFTDEIAASIKEGKSLKISGLFNVDITTVKGRAYYNFKTKSKTFTPDRKVVRIKPNATLRDALKD